MENNQKFIPQFKIRNIAGKNFQIQEVYNSYRAGWIEQPDGKKLHREFIYFPVVEDIVLTNGTERIKQVKEIGLENKELREKIWNDGVCEFHKVKDKMNRDFFKTWKKVFDINIKLEDLVEVEVWDSQTKSKVLTKTSLITMKEVGAGKVKAMIDSLVDEEVPMIEGKDKLGNPSMVRPFDYEDEWSKKLINKYCKFKVSGEGIDTRYVWLPGKEFNNQLEEVKKEYKKPISEEIDIMDLPF